MLPRVLERLEVLKAEISAIDPEGRTDAADRVAEIAVALRAELAGLASSAKATKDHRPETASTSTAA
jgi:hypothetical protein